MTHIDEAARKHVEGVRYTAGGEVLYDVLPPVTVGAGTAANDNGRPGLFSDTAMGILRDLNLIVYLASPYTLYPHGFHMAARHASRAAAALMKRGLVAYCPIAMGHAISQDNDLPTTWEFWKGQCQPFIDAASACVVLKLDGWEESAGVEYEIEEFERQGKPVVYVTMTDLELPCGATVEDEVRMGKAA